MGSEASPEEGPPHEVTISAPFAIGLHEVSRAEYQSFCAATGRACPQAPWPEADQPAVRITWQDANDYTRWLSEQTGATYRLPSEAEWEYAARGGTQTRYPFGDELTPADGRFSYASPLSSPLPLGNLSVRANPFGLYHMLGNVREWTADVWSPGYVGAPADATPRTGVGDRVVRGGSYADGAERLRSAAREALPANSSDLFTGLRVVRELAE